MNKVPIEGRFYRKAAELKLKNIAQRYQPKPWRYVPCKKEQS